MTETEWKYEGEFEMKPTGLTMSTRELKKEINNYFKTEKMIEEIKTLRVQIDGLAQLTKGLKPVDALFGDPEKAPENAAFKHIMVRSPEINKAFDSLILAKAWLGKILGELGEETPYKNDGKRKEAKDIEPAADVAKFHIVQYDAIKDEGKKGIEANVFNNFTHIEKVDWLRQEIQKAYNTFCNDISLMEVKTLDETIMFKNLIKQHLCEARFHLGFELQRIRENR